jgi:hypothetical protein
LVDRGRKINLELTDEECLDVLKHALNAFINKSEMMLMTSIDDIICYSARTLFSNKIKYIYPPFEVINKK